MSLPDLAVLLPLRADRPRLTTEGAGHAFGSRVTFRRLDLAVTPEVPLAITGPNGAGKSTLARVLAGLLTPRAGRVRLALGDTVVPGEAIAAHVGFVAPYLGLYDALSPREHLALRADGRLPAGQTRAAVHARIGDSLEAVGLGRRADDPVGAFSTGLRQRVRIALAVVAAPPVLVFDEPTATLDTAGVTVVDAVRQAHVASGGLFVVATNDPREAAWGAQSIVVGDPSDA